MLTNRNRHITLHCEIAVYEFCFVMILRICFERMYEGILYVPCCCLYCSDNCLGTVFYLSVSSTWGRSYSLLMLRWSLTNCFVLSFRHLKSYNWLLFSSFNQWPKPLETIFFFFFAYFLQMWKISKHGFGYYLYCSFAALITIASSLISSTPFKKKLLRCVYIYVNYLHSL